MDWEDPEVDTLVGQNIRSVRRDRALTQTDLADRLVEIGFPMTERVLQSIETAARAARASELVALGFALAVSPVKFLYPQTFHRNIRIGDGRASLPASRLAWWLASPDEDPPPAPGPETDMAHPPKLVEDWLSVQELVSGCTDLQQTGDHESLGLIRAEIERFHADAAIVTTDADLKILAWNRGAEHLYGWSADEALGESMSIVHPDAAKFEAFSAQLHSHSIGRGVWHELRAERFRKDAGSVFVSTTVQAMTDDDDELIGYAGIAREVARAFPEFAADDTPETVAEITIDHDGSIASWSPSAQHLYGWREEEVIGQPVAVLSPRTHLRVERTRGILETIEKLYESGRMTLPAHRTRRPRWAAAHGVGRHHRRIRRIGSARRRHGT